MSSQVDIARRSTRGSLALFAGNVLTAAFTAGALIVIARLLGRDEYGVYTLAILVPNLLINFLGLGVNSGIVRFAAYHLSKNEPDVARRMTINGLVFLFSFGVLLSGICYVGGSFLSEEILHRPEVAGLVRFGSLYLLAQCSFQAVLAGLLGWSAMGRISISNVAQSAMRVVLGVALVLLGFGTMGAIAGYAGSALMAAALSLFFLWRQIGGVPSGLSNFSSDIRTMISYGFTLFLGQFAINITAQYVLIVLASFASNGSVGLYQSAYNITAAVGLSSSAITQALFPAFAHLQGTDGDIGLAYKYATKYMGFVVTPIIFLLMGSALQLTDIVYGSSYGAAAPYLFLLALSNVSLLFGYGVIQSFFNGVGRSRFFMAFALVGAVTQLALAPLLAIYAGLGVPGLIYSTLLANLAATVCGVLLASRYLKSRVDVPGALSTLAASVIAFLAVFALQGIRAPDALLFLLEMAVFAAVYLTVAPVVRAIGLDDLRILESATSGMGLLSRFLSAIIRYERAVIGAVSRA